MAATDTSNLFPLNKSSRRGQAMYGDFGHEMFPEKYEYTDLYEGPEMMDEHFRSVLMDTGPEQSTLFAHEEVRRNKYSKDYLNLREGARTLTDPWKSEGFDTQFHDKDERGWSTEQPWDEYRRHVRTQLEMTDFKDDGDYSVPSGVTNPYTMYARIRGSQNEFKRRFKNFDTAYTSRHMGGVGVYDNISDVFKSDAEDPYTVGENVTADEVTMGQRGTSKLSNIVHSGSKNLHVNTTTDHRVKVASYGMMLKNRGLASAESQVRMIEDDRRPTMIHDQTTRSIAKLMSSRIDGTSAKGARDMQQMGDAPSTSDRFNTYEEMHGANRTSDVVTGDIVALMGYTQHEIRQLEMAASQNNKQAKHSLNDLRDMVEYVQRLPATERRLFRDQLVMGGLAPTDGNTARRSTIINPKIMQFMSNKTKSSAEHFDSERMRRESKSLQKLIDTLPVFITKQYSGNNDYTKLMGEATGDMDHKEGMKTVNYKAKIREREQYNRNSYAIDNDYSEAFETIRGKALHTVNNRNAMDQAELDNKFGENRFLDRHGLQMGSKQTHRFTDKPKFEESLSQTARKNPKNI